MERHALDRDAFQRAAFIERLGDMPGDGFALAVRVSRQEQVSGAFHGLGDGGDMLGPAVVEHVGHGEVLVG